MVHHTKYVHILYDICMSSMEVGLMSDKIHRIDARFTHLWRLCGYGFDGLVNGMLYRNAAPPTIMF